MQSSAVDLQQCIFTLLLQHILFQLFPLFSYKYIMEDLADLYT